MSEYKVVGIHVLKTILNELGPDKEKTFIEKLTPEEKTIYTSALAFHWIPIQTAAQIFEKAAVLCSPDLQKGLEKIGRSQALINLSGIYRPLLRMATVSFAIKQVAKVWGNYFNQGNATAGEEEGKKTAHIIVAGFPELPRANRYVVTGYLLGMMELIGAKSFQVRHDESQTQAWKWTVTWI